MPDFGLAGHKLPGFLGTIFTGKEYISGVLSGCN